MGFFLSVLLIACSLIMRSMSMLAISTCGTDLFGRGNEANGATDGDYGGLGVCGSTDTACAKTRHSITLIGRDGARGRNNSINLLYSELPSQSILHLVEHSSMLNEPKLWDLCKYCKAMVSPALNDGEKLTSKHTGPKCAHLRAEC